VSQMRTYLTYGIYAPIGSMGAVAVASKRVGWDRPARSAMLGMIGAALGIERDDENAIQTLEQETGLAMLIVRPGTPFEDFHTTQVPSGKGNWRTRAEELAAVKGKDNPIVSWREYRSDVALLATVWHRTDTPRFPLVRIAEALEHPHFVLYLGRKACPLGLPLAPRIVEAETPIAALMNRRDTGPERKFFKKERPSRAPQPYIVLDVSDAPEGEAARIEFRSDRLASRKRWQFLPRGEAIIPLV